METAVETAEESNDVRLRGRSKTKIGRTVETAEESNDVRLRGRSKTKM